MTKKQLIEEVEKCKMSMAQAKAMLIVTSNDEVTQKVINEYVLPVQQRIEILWNCADIVNDMISLKTIREIKSMLKEINN